MARGAGDHLTWMEIVGVLRDAKHLNMRDPAKITDWIPLKQDPAPRDLTFYVRTLGEPAATTNQLRALIRQISPGLALGKLTTMDQQIENVLGNEKVIGLLAASFGLLATILAGIGMYGVLAYTTAQRTREIGIRIALGSTRFAVSRLVLQEVLLLVGVGIAFAIPSALLLTRLIRSQLFWCVRGRPDHDDHCDPADDGGRSDRRGCAGAPGCIGQSDRRPSLGVAPHLFQSTFPDVYQKDDQ